MQIRVIATAIVGSVFWQAVMPDMFSGLVVSVIWGVAAGVFWAQQEHKNREARG